MPQGKITKANRFCLYDLLLGKKTISYPLKAETLTSNQRKGDKSSLFVIKDHTLSNFLYFKHVRSTFLSISYTLNMCVACLFWRHSCDLYFDVSTPFSTKKIVFWHSKLCIFLSSVNKRHSGGEMAALVTWGYPQPGAACPVGGLVVEPPATSVTQLFFLLPSFLWSLLVIMVVAKT